MCGARRCPDTGPNQQSLHTTRNTDAAARAAHRPTNSKTEPRHILKLIFTVDIYIYYIMQCKKFEGKNFVGKKGFSWTP